MSTVLTTTKIAMPGISDALPIEIPLESRFLKFIAKSIYM
jgi:hypothetical protein